MSERVGEWRREWQAIRLATGPWLRFAKETTTRARDIAVTVVRMHVSRAMRDACH